MWHEGKVKIPESMRGLKFTSILFGFLVDTIGTLLVSSLLATLLASKGLSEDEILSRLHSVSGLLLMLIIGTGFTVLGGYAAGRTARQAELLNGAAVAAAGMVLGLFFRDAGLPPWYEVVSFAASIPAGLWGGYLAREYRKKKQ